MYGPEDDSGVKGTPPVYLQRGDTLVRVVSGGVQKNSEVLHAQPTYESIAHLKTRQNPGQKKKFGPIGQG